MSRIGKKIITLPAGVEVTVTGDRVTTKGPKGTLETTLPPFVTAVIDQAARTMSIHVQDEEDVKQRALWGLARQLVANAVEGTQKPFVRSLEYVGVGFRVSVQGNAVNMEVGFSHPVKFELPQGITASVEKNTLTLTGLDKQLLGETAARIRRIKPPEPYKGKGIKYTDEIIRRKAGKTASKA